MSNFKFKKQFGQNFLIDNNVINKIVSDIKVFPNSLVIEIGCGDGRLTKYLCDKFDFVLGYEIDLEVKEDLYKNLDNYDNYEIIFDDFLKRDVINDLLNKSYDNLYVVANLPYYITTPIIEKLTLLNLNVQLIRVMVQKEVGERFTALPGSKNYGSITVYLNYNYRVEKNFVVSRNCFFPKPNVDSIIISFYKKDKLFVKDEMFFYKLVRDSFKYKRKTIRNNLKNYDLDVIQKVLNKYNFDLSVRAEQLDVSIFCDIANSLK